MTKFKYLMAVYTIVSLLPMSSCIDATQLDNADSETDSDADTDSDTDSDADTDTDSGQKCDNLQCECDAMIVFFEMCSHDTDFGGPGPYAVDQECQETAFSDTLLIWRECWLVAINDVSKCKCGMALQPTDDRCDKYQQCQETCGYCR